MTIKSSTIIIKLSTIIINYRQSSSNYQQLSTNYRQLSTIIDKLSTIIIKLRLERSPCVGLDHSERQYVHRNAENSRNNARYRYIDFIHL